MFEEQTKECNRSYGVVYDQTKQVDDKGKRLAQGLKMEKKTRK